MIEKQPGNPDCSQTKSTLHPLFSISAYLVALLPAFAFLRRQFQYLEHEKGGWGLGGIIMLPAWLALTLGGLGLLLVSMLALCKVSVSVSSRLAHFVLCATLTLALLYYPENGVFTPIANKAGTQSGTDVNSDLQTLEDYDSQLQRCARKTITEYLARPFRLIIRTPSDDPLYELPNGWTYHIYCSECGPRSKMRQTLAGWPGNVSLRTTTRSYVDGLFRTSHPPQLCGHELRFPLPLNLTDAAVSEIFGHQ